MEKVPSPFKEHDSSQLILSQQENISPPVSIYFQTHCIGQGQFGLFKGQRMGREMPIPESIFLCRRVQDAI